MSAPARARDAAYSQVCREITPKLVNFCTRLVGRQTAEDLAQEVLLKAWEKRASFNSDRGAFPAWLFSIARNTAADHHRARVRLAGSWDDLCADVRDRFHPAMDAGVMADLAAAEVRRSVARLPEAQRQVLWQAFWVDATHSQIAAAANQPLGTVKGRIRLGLKGVRSDLSAAA